MQFHARRFFAPVVVAALRNAKGKTEVSLLNDRATKRSGEVRLRVMSLDGKVLREERKAVELPPLSSTRFADYVDADLLGGADAKATVAVFDLSVEGEPASRDIVYFNAAKDIAWTDPGLKAELRRDGDGYALDIHADKLARAVWVDFGNVDAELSDNALTILPDERVAVRVTSAATLDALQKALRLRSIADAVQPSSASTK
jgi:beta-mannosidase